MQKFRPKWPFSRVLGVQISLCWKWCLNMSNMFLKQFHNSLGSKARLMIILHPKKVSAHIGTDPSKTKFLPQRPFGGYFSGFRGPQNQLFENGPETCAKRPQSILWALWGLEHQYWTFPTPYQVYTPIGTRLKILKFWTFLLLTVITRWEGVWLPFLVPLGAHTCALGCTYLCLVGARTWSGPFRSISKHQKCSRSDALLETSFLASSRKNEFWTFLPPLKALKLHFGDCRQSFLGASGGPNMHKNGQKGLPRCRKAQSNIQNTLEVLRNPFPNFRKIVEFGRFRQHRLGQSNSWSSHFV